MMRIFLRWGVLLAGPLLQSCSFLGGTAPETTLRPASLEPTTNATAQLASLPAPKGVITVAVYGFRDQTGQYKQAPDSSFSTAVSQGAASMLVKALRDSKWFQPVEREGLQDLLTERKILRATELPEKGAEKDKPVPPQTPLTPARLLIEGAIVGYDYNVTTGGIGLKYLGFSLGAQYRKDQVTVNIRAVDINNGTILHSVTTTKTVYSSQVQPGVYRFISYKDLLENESGYTYNEPVQLAVQEAIEEAVLNMVVEGIYSRSWVLAKEEDKDHPLIAQMHQNQIVRASGVAPDRAVPTLAHKAESESGADGDASFLNADVPNAARVRDIPLRKAKGATAAVGTGALPSVDHPVAPRTEPPPSATVPAAAAPPPLPQPEAARKQAEQIEKKREGRSAPEPAPGSNSFLSTGGV